MFQNGTVYAEDNVSGALLDPVLFRQARGSEMKFFDGMGVYDGLPCPMNLL